MVISFKTPNCYKPPNMLPFEISQLQLARDQDLAHMVQESRSNEAMSEIINRHTGVYLSVINGFNLPAMIKSDLIDQKDTNIYSYTLNYDPNRNMKVSSYIYMSAKYECLKALDKDKTKMSDELDENAFSESFSYTDEESVKQTSLSVARQVGGCEFARVIEARHFNGEATKSWHRLGLPFSHEKSRLIYKNSIEKYKEAMKNKFSYVTIQS